MALDAKGNELEFAPNAGVWDTGTLFSQKPNAGLFALSKAYPDLDFMYGATENDPLEFGFANLVAIDLSGIPETDYRQTVSDDGKTVYDVALQPYESEPLKDVNGEILYDSNGEKLYPLKEF